MQNLDSNFQKWKSAPISARPWRFIRFVLISKSDWGPKYRAEKEITPHSIQSAERWTHDACIKSISLGIFAVSLAYWVQNSMKLYSERWSINNSSPTSIFRSASFAITNLSFSSDALWKKRQMHKRYIVHYSLHMALNLRGLVCKKEATVIDESHATKTGWCYPCTSLLSLAIKKSFRAFNLPCRKKILLQERTWYHHRKFSEHSFALSGSSRLMRHSINSRFLLYGTVNKLARSIQHCHGKFLRLIFSHRIPRRLPLTEH